MSLRKPTRRQLVAVLPLALAIVAALAPSAPAAPAAATPAAAPTPGDRKLYASPLVTIEHIDVRPAGAPAAPLAPGAGDPGTTANVRPPLFLMPPDGFTSFPQVAPPNGGGLVTEIE